MRSVVKCSDDRGGRLAHQSIALNENRLGGRLLDVGAVEHLFGLARLAGVVGGEIGRRDVLADDDRGDHEQ